MSADYLSEVTKSDIVILIAGFFLSRIQPWLLFLLMLLSLLIKNSTLIVIVIVVIVIMSANDLKSGAITT